MPFIPNSPGTYDIRRDGVTIRATAIADNRPIVYVGSTENDALYSATSYGKHPDSGGFHQIDGKPQRLGEIASVGAEVDENEVPTGYVSVLFTYDNTDYVVGFMRHVNAADADTRKPNASPRLHDANQALSALSEEVRDAVLTRHRELAQEDDSALDRLPVLVRSIR